MMAVINTEEMTLGSIVSDDISGFQGVAVARTVYLNGCIRVQVQPKELKEDGELMKAVWFDEPQLTQLTKLTPDEAPEVTGGPERSTPPSRDP